MSQRGKLTVSKRAPDKIPAGQLATFAEPTGYPFELRTFKPRERCEINGYICQIVRQARRTTFVQIVEGELTGCTVQLKQTQVANRV